MNKREIRIGGVSFPLYSFNTLVIGSGAAALNAAVCLHDRGQADVVIVTDRWGGGTSNNAGSDKQTYYKLSLAGESPDSPMQMAQDLFNGGSMHGDIALCEAQNSLQAFFNLLRLGVPFPHDRHGAYVGYKTDHDPRQRATSAGPLTSHLMFECIAREIRLKGITVLDRHEVIALLTDGKGSTKRVIGAIALDREHLGSRNHGFVIFNAVNVVMGTGGPAGMYKASVYPESQLGSTGIALEIGAIGNNLTESQFGLASTKFRWNVSGTYQQVIPRYISMDVNGNDEREFLADFFPNAATLAKAIFLKGYQWPFDPRKVLNYGSSLIDILVYHETVVRGRRAFLDFTHDPRGFAFDILDNEALDYLKKSGALLGTPIARLAKMNQPAVDLYKRHGIDIRREPLEIAVCAQHNNGGLKGNIWWESNIRHLFPVGELNGTHGVYRPGGSALNSGQVGSLRAALFISKRYCGQPPLARDFLRDAAGQIKSKFNFARRLVSGDAASTRSARAEIQNRMSACGAIIRNLAAARKAVVEAWVLYGKLKRETRIAAARDLPVVFRDLDLCLTHAVYLEAIKEYLERGGKSRGSYLVPDPKGKKPCRELGNEWRFGLTTEDSFVSKNILEISLGKGGRIVRKWAPIRPIPREDLWFEKVWNGYMKDKVIR
jgi:succinate dehydrogenase/fumarate reductase flavoprotein subunit